MAASFQSDQHPGVSAQFTTTHWSVVLAAGEASSPQSATALENLCRTYWYPLYAWLRRDGHGAEEAKDLTQEFFARLLARNQLAGVDRRKGRFRSWLLGVMRHFLAHEWEKARAQKRGGGQPVISLDEVGAEERYRLEPAVDSSPEKVFDRGWALTVLGQAAARLRDEYSEAGKQDLHGVLMKFISLDDAGSTTEAARQLDLTENALRIAVHRLRRRYQELVREEIAHTVTSAAEVDEEIRYLLAVVRG